MKHCCLSQMLKNFVNQQGTKFCLQEINLGNQLTKANENIVTLLEKLRDFKIHQ